MSGSIEDDGNAAPACAMHGRYNLKSVVSDGSPIVHLKGYGEKARHVGTAQCAEDHAAAWRRGNLKADVEGKQPMVRYGSLDNFAPVDRRLHCTSVR